MARCTSPTWRVKCELATAGWCALPSEKNLYRDRMGIDMTGLYNALVPSTRIPRRSHAASATMRSHPIVMGFLIVFIYGHVPRTTAPSCSTVSENPLLVSSFTSPTRTLVRWHLLFLRWNSNVDRQYSVIHGQNQVTPACGVSNLVEVGRSNLRSQKFNDSIYT